MRCGNSHSLFHCIQSPAPGRRWLSRFGHPDSCRRAAVFGRSCGEPDAGRHPDGASGRGRLGPRAGRGPQYVHRAGREQHRFAAGSRNQVYRSGTLAVDRGSLQRGQPCAPASSGRNTTSLAPCSSRGPISEACRRPAPTCSASGNCNWARALRSDSDREGDPPGAPGGSAFLFTSFSLVLNPHSDMLLTKRHCGASPNRLDDRCPELGCRGMIRARVAYF